MTMKANETEALGFGDLDANFDRKVFVHNLGRLLAQTREGITAAELDDNDVVRVSYKSGHTVDVNVKMDSYLAIVRDVVKML